ncbi:MAG: hypothetical protein J0I99_11870 [Devosia sp.]|uniref:hypothetical protein n=1 Tax=Devosia sp. TaxID=1871048 RepID=UPI001AD39608|nr:hypothetical protein [Devosia sp.]MBN9316431.1 hypothetical protein [Devosia sp.]
MVNSKLLALSLAALVATAGVPTPGVARSNNGFTKDEIARMCTSAYEVCYAACNRPSDTFSSTFDQQTCEMQCDASFNACVGSYGGSNSTIGGAGTPRQSPSSKKLPLLSPE